MKRVLGILAAAFYLVMTVSSALAHHSHVYFYDQCKSVAIEGRVDSIQFTDPHAKFVIRLDDDTTYTVDWITPNICVSASYSSRQRKHWHPEPGSRSWAPQSERPPGYAGISRISHAR